MSFKVKCISLILAVLLLISALPITVFAEGKTEYIKEVRISTAATESEAKQWLIDNGYKVLDFNLNQKSNGDVVYMGYTTTTNPEEAITDMAVMQMNGGYSFADYEAMLDEKKEDISFLVDSIEMVIQKAYRNYHAYGVGYKAAVLACEVLNSFVEDDSGKKLGDLLFVEEFDRDTVEKIFLQANSDVITLIYSMLTIATIKFYDQYARYHWLSNVGSKYIYENYNPHEYNDLALKMLPSFEDVQAIIEYYEKECKYIDEHPELLEGMTDEEIADYYPEDYVEAKLIYSTLSKYSYAKGSDIATLLDFFSQDVDELDLEDLYPILGAMTEMERAMCVHVGFPTMIIMAEMDDDDLTEYFDTIKEEISYYGFEDGVSIYTNVDRSFFEGGVALTNEALRESASTGDTSWYSSKNIDRELGIALGCLAGASMTTAIATAAISKKVITAEYIKHGMSSINSTAVDMVVRELGERGVSMNLNLTDDTVKALKKAVPHNIYVENKALFDKADDMVAGMKKTLSKQAYKTQNQSIQRMISTARTATYIALGVSLLFEAIRIGIKLYNHYYDREYTVIPKIIVSENSDENESTYINYFVALNQNGEYADLNAWMGERWNALYTTTDRDAGDPILASGLVAKIKSSSMPTTQSYGVHYFGETGACNLSRYLLRSTAPATYMFFTRDHSLSVTASVFSTGTVIAFTGVGLVGGIALGGFGVVGAKKLKKKKETLADETEDTLEPIDEIEQVTEVEEVEKNEDVEAVNETQD